LTRRIYPNPPIVEAVIDFRFGPEVKGETLLAAISEHLGEVYCGEPRTQQVLELKASVDGGAVSAAARQAHVLTFLPSRDGLRLVGCGDGRFSVHVLAPYPGWESFVEQAKTCMRAVAQVVEGQPIQQIVVRYIDKVTIPVEEDASFNDFLTAMPSRPEAMPGQLSGFHFLLQTSDPDAQSAATLTMASAAPDDMGRPVVLYDLHLRSTSIPCCGPDEAGWLPIVDHFHKRQRDIFEGSITDKLRETFQ
jgi:uncharacterized protein (TIGR04255 family)